MTRISEYENRFIKTTNDANDTNDINRRHSNSKNETNNIYYE